MDPPAVVALARREIACGAAELVISAGSVLDFAGRKTAAGAAAEWPAARCAIVNAANCGGLGGGGVDGAIAQAGGPLLAADRQALPVLATGSSGRAGRRAERIQLGGSVLTGPGRYGRLHVDNVIHSVGPNYNSLPPGVSLEDGDALLRGAYSSAMAVAAQAGIEYLGFSLLSAGLFRGARSLEHVLRIGVETVRSSAYPGLREVHLVAFQDDEQHTLLRVVEDLFGPPVGTPATADGTTTREAADEPDEVSLDSEMSEALPMILAICKEYEEESPGWIDQSVFGVVMKMMELDIDALPPSEASLLEHCTTAEGMVNFHQFAALHVQSDTQRDCHTQEVSSTADGRNERVVAIRQEMVRIYQTHSPRKLGDVDKLLVEWAVRKPCPVLFAPVSG